MKKLSTSELISCSLFTAIIAVGAFIQIPVPGMDYFTLQFLFVLMAGMILGSRKGAISVAVYVLLGLIGVPIFAAGGGITYIFRPSFGYLLAFILAAYITGVISERNKDNTFKRYLLASIVGFVVTYIIGLTYKYFMLNFYVGEKTALLMVVADCFPIDMPGDILLTILSAILAKRLIPALNKINRRNEGKN